MISGGFLGMRLEPGADRRHGHLVPGERTDLDQIAPDRVIGMAVLAGVAHPDQRAILEPHLTGALDLQEELVDRIVDPEQLQAALIQGAGVDVAARVVRHELAARDPAVNRIAGQLRVETAEVQAQQVIRRAMQRHRVGTAEPCASRSAAARSSR